MTFLYLCAGVVVWIIVWHILTYAGALIVVAVQSMLTADYWRRVGAGIYATATARPVAVVYLWLIGGAVVGHYLGV